MAKIRDIFTGEVVELVLVDDFGSDYLDDVIGGAGGVKDDGRWLMDSDDIEWWTRWVEREERINAAYNATLDDHVLSEYERAVIDYGYDMELLQDKLEEVLGI